MSGPFNSPRRVRTHRPYARWSELPEALRLVFVLRSIEELSVEESAATLSIPPDMVRSRHFRAKGMLRESLAKEIDLAEGDIFEFGGAHCESVVAHVLGRLPGPPQQPTG